jgi:Protein of unknown function (DUF1501)
VGSRCATGHGPSGRLNGEPRSCVLTHLTPAAGQTPDECRGSGCRGSRGTRPVELIFCGGEFGRTPYSEGAKGRDHHSLGFSIWLAGGVIKGGFVHGATDELGMQAVKDRMHVHDLHATILHLMGLNRERLTYRYSGRDFRLTDVSGRVAREILA